LCVKNDIINNIYIGIGKGIACRLASEGFQIIAVGRQKEGREAEVLDYLQQCTNSGISSNSSSSSNEIKHEFRPCNAFELSQVQQCSKDIVNDHKGIDALVMTQGMATIQGFTPTSEGTDEKLTLHYWSRAAFANCLLPSLRSSTNMQGGSVVLSILSGGVHSPYSKYKEDPELKKSYSIANAANIAGYYNDLFFDKLAVQDDNSSINFVHGKFQVRLSLHKFVWYISHISSLDQSFFFSVPGVCCKQLGNRNASVAPYTNKRNAKDVR